MTRIVVRNGVTIHHRGGPAPESTVDEIMRQLEAAFKREGWRDVTDEPKAVSHDKAYWRVNDYVDESEKDSHRLNNTASKETADRKHYINDSEYNARYASDPERRSHALLSVDYQKKKLKRLTDEGVMVPDDFNPTRKKGICVNPDPHSETFCVEFIQDGRKDEWRDVGDFTKTQFVRTGPGVHVSLCEFLEDVQRKVRRAGGGYFIDDEGGYCDDMEGHKHDVRDIVHNTVENQKVIDSIGGMLKEVGWEVAPTTAPQTGPDTPTGTLDDWLDKKGADLLIRANPRLVRRHGRALSS